MIRRLLLVLALSLFGSKLAMAATTLGRRHPSESSGGSLDPIPRRHRAARWRAGSHQRLSGRLQLV